MDTARSTFLAKAERTAAALYQTREVTGDVAIACGGETTRAHSHYLRMGSDYFCRALAEEWVVQEHGLRKLTVTDYPPAVLAVAIGWMYGISIPEAFGELKDLLGLADRLLMEELKEEVEKRLTLLVTKENYRDMCEHAETYRVQALAAACARVIVLVGADDADWGVIDKAPIVTAALARLAVPKKGPVFKKREDFDSVNDYEVYVISEVKVGMKVRCCTEGVRGVKLGEVGVVVAQSSLDVAHYDSTIFVNWYSQFVRLRAKFVELVPTSAEERDMAG